MEITYKLTQKQTLAFDYLTDEEDRKILFGGAKGGGKSFLLCLWVYQWAKHLIELFKIDKPLKYSLPVGFIGRKQGVDFTDTTLETFKKIIPPGSYEIRSQDKEIIVDGKVKILFGGLDDRDVVKKFNSAEFAFIGLDQAEETIRDDVSVLQATLRLKYNSIKPPYKEIYTANPAECWLKDDFVRSGKEGCTFIPALPDDNPYLPINYKQTLKEAFSYDPALLKAYLLGDWDAFIDQEGFLISPQDVNNAKTITIDEEDDALRIVSCDVATKHGENLTVILTRIGHTIKEITLKNKIPTTETKRLIKKQYEAIEGDSVVVDSDGIGEGVGDMLLGDKIGILEFHGGYGYKAVDTLRFKNLRSQFYWVVSKKLEKGMYSLKNIPQKEFELLRKQLCAIKRKVPDALGRIQVETKEDMLSRGVDSPDVADAFVMAEYAYFMGRVADIKSYCYR